MAKILEPNTPAPMGGVRSGVNGTPTFYINGIRHDGSFDYDKLLAAINKAEKKG